MKLKLTLLIASLLGAYQAVQAFPFYYKYRSLKDFALIQKAAENKELKFLKSSDWENGNNAQLGGFDFRLVSSLAGINLQGADLQHANFQGVDLRNANLTNIITTHITNFKFADLRGADLQKTDVRSYSLYGANIEGACLAGVAAFQRIYESTIMDSSISIQTKGRPHLTFAACKAAGFTVSDEDLKKEKEQLQKEVNKANTGDQYWHSTWQPPLPTK